MGAAQNERAAADLADHRVSELRSALISLNWFRSLLASAATKTLAATILLAAVYSTSAASEHGINPIAMKLVVHWRGRAITVEEKHISRTFYFEDDIDAYQIRTARLQSAKEVDGFIYLLFDVTGWSLGPDPLPRGHCGSGEESNLIWVKLDSSWHAVDKQSVLYASCTRNLEAHDSPAWNGDALSVTVDDAGNHETRKIEYSFKTPDKGIQVTTEKAAQSQ